MQFVLVIAGHVPDKVELDRYVDKTDNQWSIIQSIFLVQADSVLVASARTWGQFVTGKFQDVILSVLSQSDENQARPVP